MWQPERLDFAGGAACGPGIEQRRPAPILINGDAGLLDSRTLADLSPEERQQLEGIKAKAKAEKKPEVEVAQESWIKQRLSEKPETDAAKWRSILDSAISHQRLMGDFVLHSTRYGKVTVGTVLDNPDKWHRERFADPLEPEYRDDKRVAIINLRSAGKPYIWLMAGNDTLFTGLFQPFKSKVGNSHKLQTVYLN
jgi:hypothetical protein